MEKQLASQQNYIKLKKNISGSSDKMQGFPLGVGKNEGQEFQTNQQ